MAYPLIRQVYAETVPAYDSRVLMLSRTPIRAVTRIFDATDTGTAVALTSTEYSVDDAHAGFLARESRWWPWTAPKRVELSEYRLPGTEAPSWYVSYEAGYVGVNGTTSTIGGTTSTGRTLPEDIEEAVIRKITEWYLGRRANPAVKSKSVGDLAISYRSESDGAGPSAAECLLDPYRRLA